MYSDLSFANNPPPLYNCLYKGNLLTIEMLLFFATLNLRRILGVSEKIKKDLKYSQFSPICRIQSMPKLL